MAGTIPLALSQQVDGNGRPLAGALLYFFQVGTVSTPQNSYQDFGLTIPNPNPLVADQNGRIPMFYLADGQVHVRLTDSFGVVVLDYPVMQVLGPSGGGGGGGGVDPTSIASTGDFKFRPTSEILSGWIMANATTIGSATSGATQRANADTQSLFVWLWNNFSNAKCPVTSGRGASGLADFNANKPIAVPDWRDAGPIGRDSMGGSAKGGLLASNITSGGGDTVDTPMASGGEANHTLVLAEAPRGQYTLADAGHDHSEIASVGNIQAGSGIQALIPGGSRSTGSSTTAITLTDNSGGGAHNNMHPFNLVTWYIKL